MMRRDIDLTVGSLTMERARKTVEIEKILDYANGFLSAKGGTPESRYGVICLIEQALFAANRYRGFTYLEENQLGSADKPGVRWEKQVEGGTIAYAACFDDTDKTRRRYA